MRPFGCHVTIVNTLDNLGKFDGKSDEGFFVGYSLSSKAFRAYNTRTKRIKPTSIAKALSDSSWVEEMQEELLQFKLQQGHRQEEGIDYEEVFAPVARIEAIRLFLAYASFMGCLVYQMDVKSAFLYGTIEKEVYVTQPPGFKDPNHPDKVYKVVKALYGLHQAPKSMIDQTSFIKKQKGDILLVQVYVVDIIFGSINKELCTVFEKLMKDKFQMSSIGELNVKSASTPVDLDKPVVRDGDADDVDVHLYRSMIGSLMYLTTSRPDIMFAVCVGAKFQVTPKTSHRLAIKRIFRYLKGKPTLSLWYSRDSTFELVSYIDSDYATSNSDRSLHNGGLSDFGTIGFSTKSQVLSNTTAKLPILKLGEYEMWVITIKQYFQVQDYALWEVIENDNSWVSVPQTAQENGTSVTKMLQKIVSWLAIFGVVIAQEDLNSKFLNNLPPKWNTHVVVWMNKAEIETMSIDDFTSSTNDVNTAKPAYEVCTVSPNVNTDSPQSKFIKDNLEAIDLKWQLSLLSMRAKRYYQRTGKKIFINANDTAGFDKSKVECFNYHKMGHFARECRAPRNKEGQFRN
ncbi:putative ribonuclease H-like domain-containing protein [Tanacetum coccineum]